MSRQRKRDTAPELALRSTLHREGLRFYVDRTVIAGLRRRADIVFPRWRLAVFLDGCFWHGCPEHGHRPRHNASWWQAKLERNRRRDRDTDRELARHGWAVLRVWEHEAPAVAADRVVARLTEQGWCSGQRG
jgi:DNA mismatch endonuclease, patch repair protein